MKNKWEEVTLGELMTFKNGLNFTQDANGSEYNFLGVGCFKSKNVIKNDSELETVHILNPIDKDYLLKKDDLVFVRSNGSKEFVCRFVLIENDISNATYSGFCIKGVLKSEKTTSKYILKNIEAGFLKEKLKHENRGTNISNLNQEILNSLEIRLPTLNEQDKIIETLNTWDSAIEKTERLISLEEKKLSAFAANLFSGKTKVQTKDRCLSELLKEKSDLSTGFEEVFSVSVHKGLVNQIEHLGRSFAAKNTDNYNLVKYGYLVYTKSPTGDFPYGIVKQSSIKKDVIVSPLYGIYEPASNEIGLLVEFFFESPIRCKNYLYPLIQKGAKNTISISNQDFLKGKINFPANEKDITRIADYIRLSKEYISLLNKQLEKYKLQKQGLMQKLLTGEWRVK